MKAFSMILVTAGLLSGCGAQPNWTNQQKEQAQNRWAGARAQVICAVGFEHLKSGDLDKAADKAAEALSIAPAHLGAHVLMGKVLLEKGRYAEASSVLDVAGGQAPDNPEIAFLKGVTLEKLGQLDACLTFYQHARALDPANDAYIVAEAEALVAGGKPQLALELLETRMERSEADATMLGLAGEIAMLLGDPRRAAVHYRRCLDAQPKSLQVREALAKAHFFAGQYDEALEVLAVLAEHESYNRKAAWVYLMMGDAAMATNQPIEARRFYETVTVIEPEDAKGWVCLAKAAMAAQHASTAILAARRALALAPDSTEAAIVLGYTLLSQGRGAEAIIVLAPAAEKNPDQPVLQCALGRCYEAAGRTDRAIACYTRALRADPENPLAKGLMASAGLAAGEVR